MFHRLGWLCLASIACLGGFTSGCSNPAQNTILAQAPGGTRPIARTTPGDGQYTLYRVTQFNRFGQPQDAHEVASYHLPRGEPIGFRWVFNRSTMWRPNAEMQLEAFAGDHVNALGKIDSMTEKYYWADPNNWGKYWSVEPAYGFQKAVLMGD